MKKRLRKKLHLGEFREYGLELDLTITNLKTEDEMDLLLDRFIEDFVEANGLYCGGGMNLKDKTLGFVIEVGRSKEKVFDIYHQLIDWFKANQYDVAGTYHIVDLWYPEQYSEKLTTKH